MFSLPLARELEVLTSQHNHGSKRQCWFCSSQGNLSYPCRVFFFFCLLLLGIGPEIELKASDRERERLIQREVDRTKAREFWGGNQKEIKAESQTHMNQRNWGEEGEESEKRCSLLESDSIDLHSMLNHVQHSAHMAPLNVARPESVYACALVYMCIYIIYTRVCLCFYFWSTRRSVTISMSVHASVCVSLILFTCWCLPACRHMDLCVCACSPAYTACILIGLHSSV